MHITQVVIRAIIYMINVSTGKRQAGIICVHSPVGNMSDNVASHKYISKTEEVPKLFPGEHYILDISELTYKNLDDKSVFDYLNKKCYSPLHPLG